MFCVCVAGKSLTDFPDMPIPEARAQPIGTNREILQELAYDVEVNDLERRVDMLNERQLRAYRQIVECVDERRSRMFFIDAPGGTGKTFLLNTVLDHARSNGRIAIAVATSGIAALLLHGGRTAHSRFKIPIADLGPNSSCSISMQSNTAELLRRAELIVWDETSMANKNQLACVSRTLCEVMATDAPFGGKTVVFAGDFRQVLPVVRHGQRAKIVSMIVKRWAQWRLVHTLKLTQNMRVQRLVGVAAEQQAEFSDYLLRIGDNRQPNFTAGNHADFVELPADSCVDSVDSLIQSVFPDLDNHDEMANRAILTPKNEDADNINLKIIDQFPGDARVYRSADSVVDAEDGNVYPVEFLNSLTPSGLPPHLLRLKVNCPIILLRNLHSASGLCNGTRLIVKAFGDQVIDAQITSGSHIGDRVFIPRMSLTPSDTGLPFGLTRRQFPVKVCFAMTINKSQSQTMDFVGLYLPQHVFTHGQLYVALSRVGAANRTKVFVGSGHAAGRLCVFTRNIVFDEVLQ